MDPLLPHQDYRRGATAPPAPLLDSISTPRLIMLGVAVALVVVLVVLLNGGGGGSGRSRRVSPATATCERAWAENKDSVYNVARTKAEYMTNCVGVQNELEQLRRDHQ